MGQLGSGGEERTERNSSSKALNSRGAVGSWSVGWGSLASEWEVSGLLLCCLLFLLLNAGGV